MQTRVYQAGSVVYFAGDKSDRVYILKEGRAQSIFLSEETGYEAREAINVGEFFGVKSLLGDYPQEDTVQCLSDCVVIIITYEEFENLVAKNKSIIIKMLRVFSNQLRRLNKKVNKLVEKAEDEEETNQLEGLYNIGEFYFKNQKYPAGWCKNSGKGRLIYLCPGHTPDIFDCPQYQQLIRQSMDWTLGN